MGTEHAASLLSLTSPEPAPLSLQELQLLLSPSLQEFASGDLACPLTWSQPVPVLRSTSPSLSELVALHQNCLLIGLFPPAELTYLSRTKHF